MLSFIDLILTLGNLTAEVQIICTSTYINKIPGGDFFGSVGSDSHGITMMRAIHRIVGCGPAGGGGEGGEEANGYFNQC